MTTERTPPPDVECKSRTVSCTCDPYSARAQPESARGQPGHARVYPSPDTASHNGIQVISLKFVLEMNSKTLAFLLSSLLTLITFTITTLYTLYIS